MRFPLPGAGGLYAEPIGATLSRSNHGATLLSLELLFANATNSQTLTSAITGESPVDHRWPPVGRSQ